jgi:hypothetical protein
VLAHLLLLGGLASGLVDLFRLGGASLHKPNREQDIERELQVFGLPVLHDGRRELRRDQVPAVGHLRVAVADLILVEIGKTNDRLEDQRGEEQAKEDQRQAVVAEEGAHQLCVRPTTDASTMPATITAR